MQISKKKIKNNSYQFCPFIRALIPEINHTHIDPDPVKTIADLLDILISINPSTIISYEIEYQVIIIYVNSDNKIRIECDDMITVIRKPLRLIGPNSVIVLKQRFNQNKFETYDLCECITTIAAFLVMSGSDFDIKIIEEYTSKLSNNEIDRFRYRANNLGLLCSLIKVHDVYCLALHPSMLVPGMSNQMYSLQIRSTRYNMYLERQKVGYLVRPLNGIIFDDNKRAFDLKIAVKNRVFNTISNKKILYLFEIFARELVIDVAIDILKLCFKICYYDWNN